MFSFRPLFCILYHLTEASVEDIESQSVDILLLVLVFTSLTLGQSLVFSNLSLLKGGLVR